MSRIIPKTKQDEAQDVYDDVYKNFYDYMSDEDLHVLVMKTWDIRLAHTQDGEPYLEENKRADEKLLWVEWAEMIAEREKQSFLETSE